MKIHDLIFGIFLLIASQSFAVGDSLTRYYKVNPVLIKQNPDNIHVPVKEKNAPVPFRCGARFGLANRSADISKLTTPYEHVHAVYGELGVVKFEGLKYGVVNAKNEVIIPGLYDFIMLENKIFHCYQIVSDSSTDLPLQYRTYVQNSYFTTTGKKIFSEKSHALSYFNSNDTLAWFRFGKNYTVRAINGTVIRKFRANDEENLLGINNNLQVFSSRKNNRLELTGINSKGKTVFRVPAKDPDVTSLYQITNNLFGLLLKGGVYNFCDSSGTLMPYSNYYTSGFHQTSDDYFMSPMFIVRDKSGKHGLMDNKGKLIFKTAFRFLSNPNEGLCFAIDTLENPLFLNLKGETVFRLTSNGKEIVNLYQNEFREPVGFNDNLFVVNVSDSKREQNSGNKADKSYAIDKTGKQVFSLPQGIRFISVFSEGLAAVANEQNKIGFVNTSGKLVIEPTYSFRTEDIFDAFAVLPKFRGGIVFIQSRNGYIDKTGKEFFTDTDQ